MSTNFLNRRMDLHHTLKNGLDNYLTMDTSYPVKLAGKVLKIFIASEDFNTNNWFLINTNNELILEIPSDKVFDFSGAVLNKNSIGKEEGKIYPENKYVYKSGDYVMAIIDFDNASLHLCSQTNFYNFFHRDSGNVRLYTIDGDKEVGFEFPIDTDIFDEAAENEILPDKYSLVRSDIDKVLYENPKTKAINSEETMREMVPVANLKNININALNTAMQPLIYPCVSNGTYAFDSFGAMIICKTINGSLSDEFIKEFCFTDDELRALPIYDNMMAIFNMAQHRNSLSNNNKDLTKYYYIITAGGGAQYSYFDTSFNIIPIEMSSKSFATYDTNTRGITCNGETVTLTFKANKGIALSGTAFPITDKNKGYYGYVYEDDSILEIRIDNNSDDSIVGGLINCSVPYKKFVDENKDWEAASNYRLVHDAKMITNFINSNIEAVKKIVRFIDFFGIRKNNDYSYKNFILNMTTSIPNSVFSHQSICFKNRDTGAILDIDSSRNNNIPKCVVTIYPEYFEDLLYNKSVYLKDLDYSIDKSYSKILNHSNEYYFRFLLYELYNHNKMDGKLGVLFNQHGFYDTKPFREENVNGTSSTVKFRTSRTMLGNNFCSFINKNKKDENVLYDFVTVLSLDRVRNISEEDEEVNNTADIGHRTWLVIRNIKFANEYISYTDGVYKIKPDGVNLYNLLIPVYDTAGKTVNLMNANEENWKKSIDDNCNTLKFMYLYYRNTENNWFYRIKYYWDESKDTNNNILTFDYYTEKEIFPVEQIPVDKPIDSLYRDEYTKAFVNAHMTDKRDAADCIKQQESFNEFIRNNQPKKIIEYVINAYKITPVYISGNPTTNPFASKDTSPEVSYFSEHLIGCTSTISVSVLLDLTFRSALAINKNTDSPDEIDGKINKDKGFRLLDIIGDSYSVYQNPFVPYVSDTEVNGAYVYNLYTYNQYLKHTRVDEVFHVAEFPNLNGIGIREEYYSRKNEDNSTSYLSLYDFYNYIITRDLSIPLSDDKSYLNNNGDTRFIRDNRSVFTKASIRNIKAYHSQVPSETSFFEGYDGNHIKLNTKIFLKQAVDVKSLMGFNPIKITQVESIDEKGKYTESDVTSVYFSDDLLFINQEEAGMKKIYSVSMNDGNPMNTALLPINGVLDDINVDTINWYNLLLALNNNKSIDILSDSLIRIKSDINNDFIDTTQVINDKVTVDEYLDNITTANSHDTIFDDINDDGNLDEVKSKYYKDKNAEFDVVHNIYKYNYGYGFKPKGEDTYRTIKNRGVIVFVTDDEAKTQLIKKSYKNPEEYEYNTTEGQIFPKLMCISKDGILCTREYFDKENGISSESSPEQSSNITTVQDLQSIIDSLQIQINSLQIQIDNLTKSVNTNINNFNTFYNITNGIGESMEDILLYYRFMFPDINEQELAAVKTNYKELSTMTFEDINSLIFRVSGINTNLTDTLAMGLVYTNIKNPPIPDEPGETDMEAFADSLNELNDKFDNVQNISDENMDNKKSQFVATFIDYMDKVIDYLYDVNKTVNWDEYEPYDEFKAKCNNRINFY